MFCTNCAETIECRLIQYFRKMLVKSAPWARATKNVKKPQNQMCESCRKAWRFLHTLISLINVELGINVEGGIFGKKLVHKSNKRGVEGGKI